MTLREIGSHYGMTRERVRQLTSRHGLNRRSGGMHKSSVDNKARKAANVAARRDARAILYYGCPYAELLALNDRQKPRIGTSNAGKFRIQKNNALVRGVVWAITFPQWMQVWQGSGHWQERGRARDAYVMARRGDTGPYALGNVYITTLAGNTSDYQSTLKRRGVICADGWSRLPEKSNRVSERSRGRCSPLGKGRGWTMKHGRYQVLVGSKYIGTFGTPEQARTAYLEAVAQIREAA
jgi:hypothetical protein